MLAGRASELIGGDGILSERAFAPVAQLPKKAAKITLSNISPFINNKFFRELSMEE